jgi:hypothetical protein
LTVAGVCNVQRTRKVCSLEQYHRYGRKEIVAKTYQLDTMVSPYSLLSRARRAASENGAILVGDERSGRFLHEMAKGEYCMVGQKVIVTVTDRHWLLPWPIVEVRMRELVL